MTVHSRFAEDLAFYALGTLEGKEQVELEKHLKECAECRHELEQLRGDAALLALSVSGPAPPQRARGRLYLAIFVQRFAELPSKTDERNGTVFSRCFVSRCCVTIAAGPVWAANAELHGRRGDHRSAFGAINACTGRNAA